MVRFLGLACVVALIGFVQAADHKHHDGAKLCGGKINTNGKHSLGKHGKHEYHAHCSNGKVDKVTHPHPTMAGKEVSHGKKFKSKKAHAALPNSRGDLHYVVAETEVANSQVLFVGFAFAIAPNQYLIFWFPVNLVAGGDAGTDDYDAMT